MEKMKQKPIYLSPEQLAKLEKISIERLGIINANRTMNLLIRDYELKEAKK